MPGRLAPCVRGFVASCAIFVACAAVAADLTKVYRTAFPTGETGFDPAKVSDLYSNEVNEAITGDVIDADDDGVSVASPRLSAPPIVERSSPRRPRSHASGHGREPAPISVLPASLSAARSGSPADSLSYSPGPSGSDGAPLCPPGSPADWLSYSPGGCI